MSLNRLAIASLFLFPSLACAEPVRCPDPHDRLHLASVALFDGPPNEHADLMPDKSQTKKNGDTESTWEVAYLFEAGRKLYVECRYGAGSAPVVLQPTKVRACTYVSSKVRGNSLVCG